MWGVQDPVIGREAAEKRMQGRLWLCREERMRRVVMKLAEVLRSGRMWLWMM